MGTWPADLTTKVNFDQTIDDPSQARAEFVVMQEAIAAIIAAGITADTADTVVLRDSLGSVSGKQLISTQASGTPPFVVSSNTLVPNLHAATADNVTSGGTVNTGAIVATSIDVGNGAVTDLDSGTYTPTYTNVNNTSSGFPAVARWLRVGSTVTVSGQMNITFSGGSSLEWRLSLPVSSTFSITSQCSGISTVSFDGSSLSIVDRVSANTTNNEARFTMNGVTATQAVTYHYTYEVI